MIYGQIASSLSAFAKYYEITKLSTETLRIEFWVLRSVTYILPLLLFKKYFWCDKIVKNHNSLKQFVNSLISIWGYKLGGGGGGGCGLKQGEEGYNLRGYLINKL